MGNAPQESFDWDDIGKDTGLAGISFPMSRQGSSVMPAQSRLSGKAFSYRRLGSSAFIAYAMEVTRHIVLSE
jgi:hypothetical protein